MNLSSLCEICEEFNIDIDYFPMKEIESFSMPGQIVIDPDKMETSKEEKVHLAHEIGHIEYGGFYNNDSPLDIRAKHERLADIYAIRTLIPYGEIKKAVSTGLTEIWELAEYFGVTCQFMDKAIRYYEHIE